jgi:carbamoyl-phosphate synthase large subunit
MQIVHDDDHLAAAMEELAGFGSLGKEGGLSAERPVLIDQFLADATEVDVDAIRDHTGEVLIGGVMEHVEEAGVHSGDSACAIPPQTLPSWVVEVIESYAASIAKRLDVRGLINVQFAVAGTTVYVIEANPRASRTVPFVAKATGVPLAKIATRVMLGATLAELRTEKLLLPPVGGGHHGPGGRQAGAAATRVGEGSGPAVHPLPGGRPGARTRDAFDRRGHGHRHHVRAGVLQGRTRRRHRAADRARRRHGLPLTRRS